MIPTDSPVLSRTQLWMAALKPPMYSVAIVPILVGTAIAYRETGRFDAAIFWTFILAAIAVLAWINITNDVFDSETGIDKNKPHSLVNLTGKKSLIFWVGNLFLAAGISGVIAISYWQRDGVVFGLVSLACALGYSYQGPPFRFGYRGLGEMICFCTFGPIATGAAYYSQAGTFSLSSVAASVPIGITTSLILFCSHFHQVEDDRAAGKTSPIVRLGTSVGSRVLSGVTGLVYVPIALGIAGKVYPVGTGLIFASLPFAWRLVNHVRENHARPDRVSNSKFLAVNLHFFSGIFLASGYLF